MGERGPAPKPEAIRNLEGTKNRNKLEPKFKKRCPIAPSWLGKYAKEEWNRVVPEAFRVGLLTVVDETALVAYVCAYQNFRDAQAVLDKYGMSYEGENGLIKRRPECTMVNESLGVMKRYLDAFGFSPAARAKLQTPNDEGERTAESFLFGDEPRVNANTKPN